MITVTRYIDGHPSVVVRSDDETAEKMPVSWDNGDFVHLSVAGFEIAMPPATWERVWREIRAALENRRPRPAPLSVTGKNAEHVHTLVDARTVADREPVMVRVDPTPRDGA